MDWDDSRGKTRRREVTSAVFAIARSAPFILPLGRRHERHAPTQSIAVVQHAAPGNLPGGKVSSLLHQRACPKLKEQVLSGREGRCLAVRDGFRLRRHGGVANET